MDTVAPKHPRASHFGKNGLFREVKSFSELELRIAALSEPTDRGWAFEVFAEAYLSTQKQVQAAQVWPTERIPVEVKHKLQLPSKDMGIDGIFEDAVGDYSAYQVKFRKGRPALTWKELSTFFGLADAADMRVVFTNCNDLAEVVARKRNFFCIRGSDLDRLEPHDFDAISSWLQGTAIERKPKTPWRC